MPTTTFNNLSSEKRRRVDAALLNEFSQHSLATAQVSRIVKDAGIARGAFYKYFDDLQDAYLYLYQKAMRQLHQPLDLSKNQGINHYVKMVETFLDDVNNHQYRNLVRLHLQTNAGLLSAQDAYPAFGEKLTTQQWMIMVLVHQTLIDCMNYPKKKGELLQRLKKALQQTLKEE